MFKLYRGMAIHLLTILLWARGQDRISYLEARDEVLRRLELEAEGIYEQDVRDDGDDPDDDDGVPRDPDPPQIQLQDESQYKKRKEARDRFERFHFLTRKLNIDIDNDDTDELIDKMIKQLYQLSSGYGSKDQDLIDKMVEVLKLPHASGRIGGKAVDSLRKAILIPEEYATLKATLNEKEFRCFECGVEFGTGEMCTMIKGESRAEIYCTRCVQPSSIGKIGCKHSLALSSDFIKKLGALIKHKDCDLCRGDQGAREAGITDIDLNVVPPPTPYPAAPGTVYQPNRNVVVGGRAGGNLRRFITPDQPPNRLDPPQDEDTVNRLRALTERWRQIMTRPAVGAQIDGIAEPQPIDRETEPLYRIAIDPIPDVEYFDEEDDGPIRLED